MERRRGVTPHPAERDPQRAAGTRGGGQTRQRGTPRVQLTGVGGDRGGLANTGGAGSEDGHWDLVNREGTETEEEGDETPQCERRRDLGEETPRTVARA